MTANRSPWAGNQRAASAGGSVDELTPLEGYANRSEPLPMSFGQQRLWFLDQLSPQRLVYGVYECVRLGGAIDVEALRQAIQVVVGRHESLRTVFEFIAGQPMQRVLPTAGDWSLLDIVDGAEDIESFLRDYVCRPFDVCAGPLLRGVLLRSAGDHVLCLCAHHVVVDGWSFGIMLDEISRCYTAYVSGAEPELSPVPVGYADFAVWQRDWLLSTNVLSEQVEYWRKALRGAPDVLNLPWDRPRPATPSFRGGVHRVRLVPSVLAEVKAVGLACNATPFMVLLAAFMVVLARWSGQRDVVVGTPITGRGRVELESVVGFFGNTLVLRIDMGGDPSFDEVLARVRTAAVQGYAHQDVPFEVLVERLALPRELSHNPLFQVLFTVQMPRVGSVNLAGVSSKRITLDTGIAKFDLSMIWEEDNAGLAGEIEFDTALFDLATIEQIGEYYLELMANIRTVLGEPMGRIALLSPLQRDQIVALSTGPVHSSAARPVTDLIAAQAESRPDALAVRDDALSLTYGELGRRANQLAHHLKDLGVLPDTLVGVVLRRSAELVVALLGVLKSGAAYVPIDPATPSDRIGSMLRQARPSVVITQSELTGRIPADGDRKLVLIDRYRWDDEPRPAPAVITDRDSLAYLVFTSGSTGEPKGALIHHRGLSNLCDWHRDFYRPDQNDRVTLLAAVTFDALAWEIWPQLTVGASVHIVHDATRTNPEALRGFLLSRRITQCFLPTPLAQVMAEMDWPPEAPLRLVFSGGDRLHWPTRSQPWELYNNYGPSECTVVTTAGHVFTSGRRREFPSLGRPIQNVRTYVLDEQMGPRPLGTPGDLYIGGANVGRGYLGDPALTAMRFVPDPFGPPGSVLYDSGDVVRLLPDGNLEFLGRRDDQVKIRGSRVEPAEIEAALRAHPLIWDAVVVPHDRPDGIRQLVGYLLAPGRDVDSAAARAHLRGQVPDYMIPAHLVVLDQFPLTVRGKVDRQALPEPAWRGEPPARHDSQSDDLAVAAIWSDVLAADEFGFDDNFFDVGGNSVLLANLVERYRSALGLEVQLVELFANPTVHAQADLVRSLKVDASERRPDG